MAGQVRQKADFEGFLKRGRVPSFFKGLRGDLGNKWWEDFLESLTNPASDLPTEVGTAAGFVSAEVQQTVTTFNATHQTITGNSGSIPGDDSIPQSSEGTALFSSAAYTPVDAANNTLRVDVVCHLSGDSALTDITVALFDGENADAIGAGRFVVQNDDSIGNLHFSAEVPANFGTPPYTFDLRWAGIGTTQVYSINGDSVGRVLGGALESFIRITEFKT